jgi:hypothetical protein
MEKKDFKRLFPNISEEIESGSSKVDLNKADEILPSTEPSYKEDRKYAGYQPGAVDFIRRCRKPQEAEEIIAYLEKKGDITIEDAKALRRKLNEEGLRSFGPWKKPGDYER